jgi:hypothetical protein
VAFVLDMLVQVVPPLVEDCHINTDPVWPVNVMFPLLLPEHTVAAPPVVPPTVAGFTVNVAVPLNVWPQPVVVFVMLFNVTVGLPAANVFVVIVTALGPVPVTVVADEPVTV